MPCPGRERSIRRMNDEETGALPVLLPSKEER